MLQYHSLIVQSKASLDSSGSLARGFWSWFCKLALFDTIINGQSCYYSLALQNQKKPCSDCLCSLSAAAKWIHARIQTPSVSCLRQQFSSLQIAAESSGDTCTEKSILFPATASASILSANAVPRSVHPYPIWLYSFVFYFFHSRISAIHRVKDSIDPRESLSVPASPSALFTVNSPLLIFLPFFTHLGKTILYCSSCQQ